MPDATYPLPLPCKKCGGSWEHLSLTCRWPPETMAEWKAAGGGASAETVSRLTFVESAVDEVQQLYDWADQQKRDDAWLLFYMNLGPKPEPR